MIRKNIPGRTDLWAEIVPLTFGRARIVLTDGYFVADNW